MNVAENTKDRQGPALAREAVGYALAALALLSLFVEAPRLLTTYQLHIAVLVMIFLFPALGLNLIFGYTGMLSLGQGAFFGIGAYVSALLAQHFQWPFVLTFLAAGFFCAIVALVLGVPALRLRTYSFVMCTLSFVVISEVIAKNWVSVTHGDMALSGIPRPGILPWTTGPTVIQPGDYYYLFLPFALFGLAIFYWLIASPAGRCMVAIRDGETLAGSQGVPIWTYRMLVFAMSAFYAGLGGSMYAHYMTVVSPLIFDTFYTFTILTVVIAGGAGTFIGVPLGTVLFIAIPEVLRVAVEARMLVYGFLLLVLVFWLPGGVGPLLIELSRCLSVWTGRRARGHAGH